MTLNTRIPKRIDWKITKNIIEVLYREGKEKKTNIAMRSGLSYDNCLLYLNWLDLMDLINREIGENKFELISLTDKGRDLYAKKLQ